MISLTFRIVFRRRKGEGEKGHKEDFKEGNVDPQKILNRKAWQPTPVFLPGESHGQRSLAGYSPWGPKESDMTEVI